MQTRKELIDIHRTLPVTKYPRDKHRKVLVLVLCGISFLVIPLLLCGKVCSKWPAVGASVASYLVFGWQRTNHVLSEISEPNKGTFNWQMIRPSAVLDWVDCYSGNECARLELPLDYSNPNDDKAAVALVRVKAKVSPQSKEYRGPVLFNPGGPGGSGIEFILERGQRFQQILGKEYDIIGFDPRGIGETTPSVSIFPDDVERGYWDAGIPPLPNSTADALSQGFFRTLLFNGMVEHRSKRAAKFSSTAVVARDMLSITKAHGRDRLQYWGFSYGTILGATYAAMFPDNIERLIIDGVADFDDYYSGSWSKNLLDTDGILDFLYDHCASAGSTCPLHANSSALVKERVESIFTKIKTHPVAAISDTDYGLVDYRVVKAWLFRLLYQPFAAFPLFAQAMAALEDGDGRLALAGWKTISRMPKCSTPPSPVVTNRLESGLAVMCSDGEGAHNTLPDITQHLNDLGKISVFADVWTETTRARCAGWRIRAKERFAGPFVANTSFPLLIIGNTADPVTPLVGAQKAARGFRDSVLVTVDTPGHTSASVTSLCVTKIVRNYFANGKLPKEGTLCDVEDVLFGEKPTVVENMTPEDAELLEVSRSLSRDFYFSKGSPLL